MLRRSVIVGKPNVGKTLFCVHFAQYLGVRDLVWFVERTDGRTEQRRMSVAEAKRTLSDIAPHRTRCLQSIHLEVPRGKGARQLLLTDSTGLSDGMQVHPEVRTAMAQTLQALVDAHVILHMVDLNEIGQMAAKEGEPSQAWRALDEQLCDYGADHPGYILLANKMDLPAAKLGYKFLRKRYPKQSVIPMSALNGAGFREVKQHVWRLA